jgi:hypothetical protein
MAQKGSSFFNVEIVLECGKGLPLCFFGFSKRANTKAAIPLPHSKTAWTFQTP